MECGGEWLAKVVDVDMNEYEAREVVFHTPAEHQVNSHHSSMEMQVIFHPLT